MGAEVTGHEYGQHRPADAPTVGFVVTVDRKGRKTRTEVPLAPAIRRQWACINARAYDAARRQRAVDGKTADVGGAE